MVDWMQIAASGLREERPGRVNFMARGIFHASVINTVSQTYAREIMTPEGGVGLDGLLRHRRFDVHGILNGLDEEVWDPAADPHLAARFDLPRLAERRFNKKALQARSGLPQRDDVPLVGMVTRLDAQKGIELVTSVVPLLLNGLSGDAQFVILGSGDPKHETALAQLASTHRDKMAAFLTYSPDLAPLVYGGSDVFLMPSLFEPCGLGQLIAMRYGSVPVVRSTAGSRTPFATVSLASPSSITAAASCGTRCSAPSTSGGWTARLGRRSSATVCRPITRGKLRRAAISSCTSGRKRARMSDLYKILRIASRHLRRRTVLWSLSGSGIPGEDRQVEASVRRALLSIVTMSVIASSLALAGDHKCTMSTQECLNVMAAKMKSSGWIGSRARSRG